MAMAVVFFVGENMATEKKQHSEELKEKILAEIATGVPMTQLSKKYKIPVSTMGTWKTNARTKSDEFENLRKENKEKFVNKAWKLINDAMEVTEKRVTRCKNFEENVDIVANAIKKNSDKICKDLQIGYFDLLNLVKELMQLKNIKVGELSSLIGTMYDKQALASDEPTENVKVKLEDFF